MKRQKKRLLGFFGLFLVAIMTIVAATIPGPGTSALTSITDTIQVHVSGGVPDVKFKEPDQNITTTDPEHQLVITHEDVDSVKVEVTHKKADGEVEEYTSGVYNNLDYQTGEISDNINFEEHGYGEYIITLYGDDVEYDSVLIKYVPIIAGPVTQDEDENGNKNEKVVTKLEDYDDDNVETVEIYIDGELVKIVTKDELDDEIEIPMDGYDSGDYTVTFIAKDEDGNQLYLPEEKPLHYEKKKKGEDGEDIPVPGTADTGHLFKDLNISKEDYLVTGLIVFFVFGVVAFGVVAKSGSNKKTKNYKKKR